MRVREWLSLRTCRNLHEWVVRHYSEKELEDLANGKRLEGWFAPRWDPWDSPYTAERFIGVSKHHLRHVHSLYKRYKQEIWGCCLVMAHEKAFGYSMEQCAREHGRSIETGENVVETHGVSPLRMLSHLELAGRVSDADSFLEFMVSNALAVTAAGLARASRHNE